MLYASPGKLMMRGGALRPTVLASPGFVGPGVTYSRSSTATSLGSDGVTWAEYVANAPRFWSTQQWLLTEGQTTNVVPNPRAEGGGPGTLPTGWLVEGSASLYTYLGIGSEFGLPYFDLMVSGTGAGVATALTFMSTTANTASAGQVWTGGFFYRVISGSFANFTTVAVQVRALPVGGTGTVALTASASMQRAITAITGTGSTTSTYVRLGLTAASGQAVAVVIRIYVPTLELRVFASTPVLPTIGNPSVSTRTADVWTASMPSPGMAFWAGRWWNSAPTGFDQNALQIDAGADTDRYLLTNAAGGNTIIGRRVTASAVTSTATLGSQTPGTATSAGIYWDGVGNAYFAVRGGTPTLLTGGPTLATPLCRLGMNVAGSLGLAGGAAMFGETRNWNVQRGGSPGLLQSTVDQMALT